VLAVSERMVASAARSAIGIDVPLPLPRLTYAEAMDRYGSDKPDLRFGMEIVDCGDLFRGTEFRVFADALARGGTIRGIRAPGAGHFTRRELAELEDQAKGAGAAGVVPVPLDPDGVRGPAARFLSPPVRQELRLRFDANDGDLLLFVAAAPRDASLALGRLRLSLGSRLGLIGGSWAFTWVLEFPLLEPAPEPGRMAAVHHPFTAPMDEDLPLLDREPLRVRAKAYDLVLNGVELGGGSIRIHRQDLQARMFSMLGVSEEAARQRFGFLLDAFRYGAPPHGGIALGFDRLAMMLAGQSSIREVIAFPKTQSATDLMTGAPSEVDLAALEEVHIRVQR